MSEDVALAMFRRKYGREPVPESFDQSRLADCREAVAFIWPEVAALVAEARTEERGRVASLIDDAALHVMGTVTSDEGAALTAAILERAASIVREARDA